MANIAPPSQQALFMTGFTGFLGTRLTEELLMRRPSCRITALIRPDSMARARARLRCLEEQMPGAEQRVRLIEGDLGAPLLGLADDARLTGETAEIFHLAALYDLSCPADRATAVNLEGTRNVLDFARRCPALRRLHHVSTCYVAGKHWGRFAEDDLDVGQHFLNAYDRTKFAAEQLVRGRASTLPVTIYRPAIVVGDSRTGEIPKFDGPYFVMQAMMRLPRLFVFPRIDSGSCTVNVVPVDFVARALAYLSALPQTLGHTYHLADSRPVSVLTLERELMGLLGRRFLLLPVSLRMACWMLRPRAVQRYLGLPAAAVPYFGYRAWFDTTWCTRHLAGSGIQCPPLTTYLPVLIDYWRRNRDRQPASA